MFGQLGALRQPSDRDIDAPSAWNQTTGSSNVIVAVIDSGVAYGHRPERQHLGQQRPARQRDDDGTASSTTRSGGTSSRTTTHRSTSTGTDPHVGGTIGAEGNNGAGVTGVNWNVSLMPVQAGAGGSLEDADIIAAIEYACDNGADVVNGSFGSPSFSVAIANAVSDLSCANTLFVFAQGRNDGWDLDTNSGDEDESYPSELHRPHERVERPLRGGHRPCGYDRRVRTVERPRFTWPRRSEHPQHVACLLQPSGLPRGYEGSSLVLQQPLGRPGGLPSWNRTTLRKKGGSFSLADSPTTNYPNAANRTIRLLAPLNLAGRAGCFVEPLRLDAESQFDFFDVRGDDHGRDDADRG